MILERCIQISYIRQLLGLLLNFYAELLVWEGFMVVANFELKIPLKAEYVSIARLTVSGVANRAGFDFDAIEDIKVCLSEVCNRLINNKIQNNQFEDADCRIQFVLSDNDLAIDFYMDEFDTWEPEIMDDDQDEYSKLGLSLLNLLMDDMKSNPSKGCVLSMRKNIES